MAYGPLLVLALMRGRATFAILTTVALISTFRSDRPLHQFAMIVGVFGGTLAWFLGASAVGGLVYSLLGRRIRELPFVGPPGAVMVSVLPYFMAVIPFIRLSEGSSLLGPVTVAEWAVVLFCTGLFGGVIGVMFIRWTHSTER